MKVSTFVTMLLGVGIVIFVMINLVSQSEEVYNIEVNKTALEGQYDFASDINNSVAPIKQSIDDITSEETGWLTKVGSGFTGIISAVTFLPSLVWNMGAMGTSLINGLGLILGVPPYLISVFIIMLIIWGIIQLVQFFQRWNI